MKLKCTVLGLTCLLAALLLWAASLPWTGTTTSSVAAAGSSPWHVVVNEVAWGGTAAGAADEWIELHNTANVAVSLEGWHLTAADGAPDIHLQGLIAPYGYYLIERTDDTTIADITADLCCSFGTGLSNAGEALTLIDAEGNVVDTVNADGGAWPTEDGGNPSYRAMERTSPITPDSDGAWISNDGTHTVGHDADGMPINGTPRTRNAAFLDQWSEITDVWVAKQGPDTAVLGNNLVYTLTAANAGGITATNLELTDHLPGGLGFIAQGSSYPFTNAGPHLTWTIPTLAPDARAAFTLSISASAGITAPWNNRISITSPLSDICAWNDTATWSTTAISPEHHDSPQVLISGVLYDGYQLNDMDEAVRITNLGDHPVSLTGWTLCERPLPSLQVPAGESVWLSRDAAAFRMSFGFSPTVELERWPQLANTGAAVLLREAEGLLVDALVYGDGTGPADAWVGPTLRPYDTGVQGLSGQILTRAQDERNGVPITDTNTTVDWLQHPGIAPYARQVRYPGWDSRRLAQPFTATVPATVTLAIAPDNAYEAVAATLMKARTAISIETYTFRHRELLDILAAKAQQGVAVTVLLEGNPVGLGTTTREWSETLAACQILEEAGGACWFMIHEPDSRIHNRYAYLHAKLIIVDDRQTIVGSQNLTASSLPADDKANGTSGSRGAVLIVASELLAARAREIFRLDLDPAHHADILRWNTDGYPRYGTPPPGTTLPPARDEISYTVRFPSPRVISGTFDVELYTAPDAALRRTDALLGLVHRAQAGDTIEVMQQYERATWGTGSQVAQNPRLASYLEAARRGARVRILLNRRSYVEGNTEPDPDNLATVQALNAAARTEGLDLYATLGDPTGDGIHNKMVLVDLGPHGRYTHLGSLNGSEAASKVNREIALHVRSSEIYDYYHRLFSSDWHRALPVYLPLIGRDYTPSPPPADYLLISEVCYSEEAAGEWIEIANPGPDIVDLTGYKIGDAETPGAYEPMFRLPAGWRLDPGGLLVIAVNAAMVPEADIEFYESVPGVPNLEPYDGWGDARYPLALRNAGDQVILLDAQDRIVDAVAWGDRPLPDGAPHPGVKVLGASLERFPADQDTDDAGVDFRERYPPTPGELPDAGGKTATSLMQPPDRRPSRREPVTLSAGVQATHHPREVQHPTTGTNRAGPQGR